MPRRRSYTPEHIITKLREAEILIGQGKTVKEASKQLEISEQDANLAGYIAEKGRALIVAVNKWDGLDGYDRSRIVEQLDRRLPFLGFATTCFISALHGTGVGELFPQINKAYASAMREMATPELTRILEHAVEAHPDVELESPEQLPRRNGFAQLRGWVGHGA